MQHDKLTKQVEETEAMLRRRKAQVAQALNANGNVSAEELDAITRLEIRLSNMQSILEANELTRRRPLELEA